MRKYILCGLGVLIALISIFVIVYVRTEHKIELLQKENEVLSGIVHDEKNQNLSSKIAMLQADQLSMVSSSGEKISKDILLCDDEGNEIILGDISQGRRKFIFRYSYLNCNVCVDALIPMIKTLAQEIGDDNVIFIATYKNERNLHVFKRINQIRSQIYNIESLPIILDDINTPYCFVLEKDDTISHVFIPRKEMIDHAQDYFNVIGQLFR